MSKQTDAELELQALLDWYKKLPEPGNCPNFGELSAIIRNAGKLLKQVPVKMPDSFFRQLDDGESKAFRKWARDNYKPNDPINEVWHPAVRAECQAINEEAKRQV